MDDTFHAQLLAIIDLLIAIWLSDCVRLLLHFDPQDRCAKNRFYRCHHPHHLSSVIDQVRELPSGLDRMVRYGSMFSWCCLGFARRAQSENRLSLYKF